MYHEKSHIINMWLTYKNCHFSNLSRSLGGVLMARRGRRGATPLVISSDDSDDTSGTDTAGDNDNSNNSNYSNSELDTPAGDTMPVSCIG